MTSNPQSLNPSSTQIPATTAGLTATTAQDIKVQPVTEVIEQQSQDHQQQQHHQQQQQPQPPQAPLEQPGTQDLNVEPDSNVTATSITITTTAVPPTSRVEVTQETLENSDLINWTIFQELLMMDEDEEGFALSLIQTFIEQASGIFQQIKDLLTQESEENLNELSSKGHYLKGSAAALGLQQVQNQCERIQNYGKKNNFDEFKLASDAKDIGDWYACIQDAYEKTLTSYDESKNLLGDYFGAAL
ncbi:unnamed protein product [Ambrosiozyma monospora]|uniref:Unnamed protein product n=1 Tax=Ambrosiozyma monospora TaxID=43982 RepID=A0A9W6YU63_AMBMO|nr:unnamed protein product [Ambrosiozyma monospora]